MQKAKERLRRNTLAYPESIDTLPVLPTSGYSVYPVSERQPDLISKSLNVLMNEEKLRVLSSIRQNVLRLPEQRYDEIFGDFAKAAETRDIDYLADTILNWALGGHGYEYTGEPIHRLMPIVSAEASDEDRAVWEEMWPGGNQ